MSIKKRWRQERPLRIAARVMLLAFLGVAIALEQRMLIGAGVGAYWLMSQIVMFTLSSRWRGRERRLGKRFHPGLAPGPGGRAGRGRRALPSAGGGDVPQAQASVPRCVYRNGHGGPPYEGPGRHRRRSTLRDRSMCGM